MLRDESDIDREASRESRKRYRESNREKIRQYQRKWQERNREKTREYQRQYRARQKKYRPAPPSEPGTPPSAS